MSLAFPASPTVGDTYTVGARTWSWSGTIWEITGTVAAAGSIGTTELADSAITTAKIAAGAVVEADIASNAVTTGKLGTDVQLGYRNVVINGAMQIAQRGSSAVSIAANARNFVAVDRFFAFGQSADGVYTVEQSTDVPSSSNFINSFKATCTTSDASVGAAQVYTIGQIVEGSNLAQYKFGSANASTITLSFWVKSSLTGTYCCSFRNNDVTRCYPVEYTINSANTWEKKTITVAGDTTGTWLTTTGIGMRLEWTLAAGTDFQGTNATWVGTSKLCTSNQVNWLSSSTTRTFFLTGVQLEVGSVATPFEFEDFGVTLRKCKRYYEKTYDYGTAPGTATNVGFVGAGGPDGVATFYAFTSWRYQVEKRAVPTVTIYDVGGNSGKVSTWQSGGLTSNVSPDNGNWINGTNAHSVLEQGSISGFFYQAVSSAEL